MQRKVQYAANISRGVKAAKGSDRPPLSSLPPSLPASKFFFPKIPNLFLSVYLREFSAYEKKIEQEGRRGGSHPYL
jgi:hypothetical protein